MAQDPHSLPPDVSGTPPCMCIPESILPVLSDISWVLDFVLRANEGFDSSRVKSQLSRQNFS